MNKWINKRVTITGLNYECTGELLSLDYVPAVLGIERGDVKGGYRVLIRLDGGDCEEVRLSPHGDIFRNLEDPEYARRWQPMSKAPSGKRIEVCLQNKGGKCSTCAMTRDDPSAADKLCWRPFGEDMPTEHELYEIYEKG